MAKPIVLFRADGHAQMGLGHLIRSAALAEMLRDDFHCVLVRRLLPQALLPEMERVYAEVIESGSAQEGVPEAADLVELAKKISLADSVPIVVLDGYHFGTEYQRVIKEAGLKLVCIDDIHAYPFVADVVVNHAPGVAPFYAALLKNGRLVSGLDYALLRSPFLRAARESQGKTLTSGPLKNILICLGGSDKLGLSTLIVRQLISNENNYRLVVVSGAAAAGTAELEKLAEGCPQLNLLRNLSAEAMAAEMARADAAILPASSILYEACALRLPTLSGFYVGNQERIYEGFLAAGLIEGLGDLRETIDYSGALERLESKQTIIRINQLKRLTGDSGNRFIELFQNLLT
ncbi:MAG: UDP-2,4-diacetamido-2,4,6-trideoxy-beta-L-altropyranose hydrolase [Saprospiraceae bacterium]